VRRAWPLLLALLLTASLAQASPVALGVSAQPRSIQMAHHVAYTLYAFWPKGWSVAPPRPKSEEGMFDVACDQPEIAEHAGRAQMTMRCDLIAFEPGIVELPRLSVVITGPDGGSETRAFPSVSIEVKGPTVGKEPRPIKPPEVVRRDWARIGWIAGIVVASLAVAALLVWQIVRRLRGRRKKVKDIPGEPADSRALRRLHDPQLDRLFREGRAKPYYSELTEIVREYIEGRFGLPAPDRTTSEILADLGPFNLEAHRAFLSDIFRTADLAKFAGVEIDRGRWHPDRQASEAFVEQTRPAPEPAPPAPVEAIPVAEPVREDKEPPS
jgi:hypothetical protein